MTTQTSTTNVTLVSVALLFSSLSIVMYHHMTYQMVYDGDGSGRVDAPLVSYPATLQRDRLEDRGGPFRSSVSSVHGAHRTQSSAGRTSVSETFTVVMLSYRSPKSLQHTLMYHHMTYQMVYDGDVTRHSHGSHNISVLCLASDWCNWSNQPSMYTKKWYLQHIGAPCEDTPEGRGFCIGSPGRQSAVRRVICVLLDR
jgi:hypothetical protein